MDTLPSAADQNLISIADAKRELGICHDIIYLAIRYGKLHAYKRRAAKRGSYLKTYVDRQELLEWNMKRTQTTTT